MIEFAYAKINLSLKITGLRPDGYHSLESVMQRVSLHDTLTLFPQKEGISFSCTANGVPSDSSNLCVKAAEAYFAASGVRGGVSIELQKNIPASAGLGGGSADAAAVLRALNALYPAGIDLHKIAFSLGADVPFCLSGTSAFCTGLGEEIQKIPFSGKNSLYAVIAKGADGLSTPAVYRAWDALPGREERFSEPVRNAMEKGDFAALQNTLFNDLEAPALSLLPKIGALKSLMEAYGAEKSLMTGSGSAVFSLFSDREKAERCAALLGQDGFFSAVCTLL